MKYRIELDEKNSATNAYIEADTLEEVRDWATEQIKRDRLAFGYNNRQIMGYDIMEDDRRIITATVEIDCITEFVYATASNIRRSI